MSTVQKQTVEMHDTYREGLLAGALLNGAGVLAVGGTLATQRFEVMHPGNRKLFYLFAGIVGVLGLNAVFNWFGFYRTRAITYSLEDAKEKNGLVPFKLLLD